MGDSMKIGIAFTMFNCVDYSKAAVESIRTSVKYHMILIDDFSMDGTKEWMRNLTRTDSNCLSIEKIVDEDTNSLGQKWNLAAQRAKDLGCDAVLICNNDILFSPNTIDNLVIRLEAALNSGENVALVSAHNLRGQINSQDILTRVASKDTSESEGPDFSCFLLDLTSWEKVGKFAEIYIPCYFEDNDFHTMLRVYDLKAIATTAAPYYHYGSITQNSVPDGLCKSPQFEKNRDIFIAKFDALPDKIDIDYLKKKFLTI